MSLCNYSFLVLSMVLLAQAVAPVVYIITACTRQWARTYKGGGRGGDLLVLFLSTSVLICGYYQDSKFWENLTFTLHLQVPLGYLTSLWYFRVIISTNDCILIIIWTKLHFFWGGALSSAECLGEWQGTRWHKSVQVVKNCSAGESSSLSFHNT